MINSYFRYAVTLVLLVAINGCISQRTPPPVTATSPEVTNRPPATSAPAADAPYTIPPGYVKTYVVFGQRYFILASSEGYRERGLASWYGPKFNGRPTANGEIYNMHELTAAHKSLPLPTMARVTNLDNQKSIIVRINDRGPFVGERIIDLSMAAAESIDMIGPGTANVEVVALNPSRATVFEAPGTSTPAQNAPLNSHRTTSPATTYTPPAQSVATSSYIQVGAFSNLNNATKMLNQLEQSGFENVIIQNISVDNRTLHRVRIGPLIKSGANAVLDQLINMGLNNARITSN